MIGQLGLALAFSLNYFLPSEVPADTLNARKAVLKTYFFKDNFSLRNASLRFKYGFMKGKPRETPILSDTSAWSLRFYDDFDSLDLNKWRIGQAWGEFHPEHLHQYYGKDMVQTEGGYLKLKGMYKPKAFKLKDSTISIPFAIGLVNSDISFQQKYGYFEIRSKNPQGAATWPAFWLTGANKWPPEIDIFEMYGRKSGKHIHHQYASIHYGKSSTKSRGFLSKKINLPNDTDTSFHIYGCEWTPEHLKFFTDGRLVAYIRVNGKLRAWMDEPMVVVLNNAFDEAYLKYIADIKTVNNEFVVDWIRVYERKPTVQAN